MMLEVFYEQNKEKLVAVLSRYCGDDEAAKDAVSEAFVRALQNRKTLSCMQERSLWSWLYTTAKNALVDEKRKASRVVTYRNYDYADGANDVDFTDAILTKQLLARLPQNLMHVVSLKYFGGLSSTEIGRIKGLPPATVRSQLRAAIKIMRK